MEIWKDIQGFEGLYQVSNKGNIKSLDRYVEHSKLGKKFCKGRIIVQHTNNSGYRTVNLSKKGKYHSIDVHRIVAKTFLECNDKEKTQVNHKDENKKNNDVSNLEWVSISYNNRYGTKTQRQIEKIEIPVLQLDDEGNVIKEWKSATKAEKSISGKTTGAIGHCIHGKTKTAYGYRWKLKGA